MDIHALGLAFSLAFDSLANVVRSIFHWRILFPFRIEEKN